MTALPRRRPDSPCVGLCRVEPTTGLCEGCLRSLDEIAGWGGLSPARRQEIMAALPERAPRLAAVRRARSRLD